VVRRSPLWEEIAASSRLDGSLIEFDDPPSLVESVGRVLAGLPIRCLPAGVALREDERPARWKDSAGRVLSLLEGCAAAANGKRWLEREEALRLARS
jgi:hypothetical protein